MRETSGPEAGDRGAADAVTAYGPHRAQGFLGPWAVQGAPGK